jgi:carbonic anhydrase/acetyltransferase-like protein (isoleucine patch superfamily)
VEETPPAGPRLLPYRGVVPRLARGAWVAPGATLVGDVELGPDASVWYGCVLRGDVHRIRVGARSNVQDLSVVHVTRERFATEIGADVTVGHRAVVHGCWIGDGALIGIGAIILDGATVGEGAWIGAGAVVTPGTAIPPRMLALGAPARPVRAVGDTEFEEQLERTRRYVHTAREHALAQSPRR